MQERGALLLVRLRVWANWRRMDRTNRATTPTIFGPFLDTDQVEIALPDGFKVDELPEPAKAAYPFGQYTSKTEIAGNLLKYSREYRGPPPR